jgi:DoxX-like family
MCAPTIALVSAGDGIYVEIVIAGSIDDVWTRTQDPTLHGRWDLRFTSIEYLPRPDLSAPQRFLYATRIGLGLGIEGEGESVGRHDGPGGVRTSALEFWSDDRRSLIRRGSGYWKYMPVAGGVKFLTWYDYTTRFGVLGRVADRVVRPLLGWATAWSFDRLRLWIERGIDPALSLERSLVSATARLAVAGVFLWHGLVPKLLFRHPDEAVMLTDSGVDAITAQLGVTTAGIGEIVLAVLLVVLWRSRILLGIVIALMAAAVVLVGWFSPRFLTSAFNPVTLNGCVIALSVIALLSSRDLPSAMRCRRRREEAS